MALKSISAAKDRYINYNGQLFKLTEQGVLYAESNTPDRHGSHWKRRERSSTEGQRIIAKFREQRD